MYVDVCFLVNFRLRADHDVEGHSVGGLGPLSGPLWAVLGRCRGLCGRSWAEMWPKPEREQDPAGLDGIDGIDGIDGLDGMDRIALGARYQFVL